MLVKEKKIDIVYYLVEQYGGAKNQWKKKCGTGYINNLGIVKKCELYWFEAASVGRVKMKVIRFY